jgi:hypothetical protein
MERLTHVYDYTGNQIFFDQYVLDYSKNFIKLSYEQYFQAVETISAPPLIIELNINSPMRYYFSEIEKDNFLLIGVKFRNGFWKVNEYFENSSQSFVRTLLKEYFKGGSISILLQNEILDDEMGNLLKSLL